MEWALYHPDTGYYRQPPDSVLGAAGDFFTASQLQPTFGELIASSLPHRPVLELGAGRGEMRAAFTPREYLAIHPGQPLPATWSGIVFANEFFDALPVLAGIRKGSALRELLVLRKGSTYTWQIGPPLSAARCEYVERYYPDLPDGARFEIAERAADWIRRINQCLREGTVLIIDYGWTGSEYRRFPSGTLMSYRRHRAWPDVLLNPGQQDITSHVPFQLLIDTALSQGFTVVRFETLAQTLLAALEQHPQLMRAEHSRQQLKTLLFSMGESFRTLLLQKSPAGADGPAK